MEKVIVIGLCCLVLQISSNTEIEIRPNKDVQLILLQEAKIQLVNASTTLDAVSATFESMVSILRDKDTLAEVFNPMIAPLERMQYAAKDFAWSVRRIVDQITDALKIQGNNDGKELRKDIDANYELVRCGLRAIMKTVDSVKAYAANNIETYGAEGVLIPVLHTLNNVEVELTDLVGHRMVLFLSDIMG